MNTVMFNDLPVGTLFRVINKVGAKDPIPDTDIFIKVKNSKGKYRAFNITNNPFRFYSPINWDYAPIYPDCKGWECEKIKDFYKRAVPKSNVISTSSTKKRFNCILGNSDWDMCNNVLLALTDDQIKLLEYLINETNIFDEDIGLMTIDTEFKAF